MKVLLVDDNQSLLKLVQRLLVKEGCEVTTATAINDGFALAVSECPDLIMCDYEMPGGTGIELFNTLSHQPELKNVHYVLMSGYPMEPFRLAGEVTQTVGVLQKPFALNELRELLA